MDAYDGMSLCGGLVFFAPVALLVRTQAGISETQFFLLQALLSGIIALGELPTGHLTDRMGYRRSLILAQLLLLAARGLLLAAFLLRSLPLFVAEALVEGISAVRGFTAAWTCPSSCKRSLRSVRLKTSPLIQPPTGTGRWWSRESTGPCGCTTCWLAFCAWCCRPSCC